MVDYRLRDLSGPSRRRFIQWMGAVGAAFAVDRARLLDFFGDHGGAALADGMACAGVNRSVHILAGQGSFAWFQLLWPFPQIAAMGGSTVAYHAPGEGFLYQGDRPFYYGPEAPSIVAGAPKYPVTGFMAGTNETHTRSPTTAAMLGPNVGMMAATAAIQRRVPTMLPIIGVGPATNLGTAPGAPSFAKVGDPAAFVDLFSSAASQFTLAAAEDHALYETYYKAVLGLREGAKLPSWASHLEVTKGAAKLVGRNLASQLRPSDTGPNNDLERYGITELKAATASGLGPAKTKLENLARALITTAKAFKMNLTMNVQIDMVIGPGDSDFTDCHAAFVGHTNNSKTSKLYATTRAFQKILTAFYDDLAVASDPACSGRSLDETVIMTVHGDTPKTPLNRSGWPDSTPQNSNWIYVIGNGYLKDGWFGEVKSNNTATRFDPTTGAEIANASAAQVSTASAAAGAAVAYAVAQGDMSVVSEFYSGPSIAGITA